MKTLDWVAADMSPALDVLLTISMNVMGLLNLCVSQCSHTQRGLDEPPGFWGKLFAKITPTISPIPVCLSLCYLPAFSPTKGGVYFPCP